MTSNRIKQTLLALAVGAFLALPALPQDATPSNQQPDQTQQQGVSPQEPANPPAGMQNQDTEQDQATPPAQQQTPEQQPAQTTTGEQATSGQMTGEKTSTSATNIEKLPAGKKEKASGVIVRRDPDSFVLREDNGRDLLVKMSNSTEVRERKSNPFRGAKHYEATQLLRGLSVEVEGRADNSGALVADKIRFTTGEYKVAQSVESRVTPVEGRLTSTETRLTESEQNALRLSGQISELNTVANAARGGARAAQQTADQAVAGVSATNQRIGEIDDYAPAQSVTIHFKVNSAALSDDAKSQLDDLANQAKNDKGFVIQVQGFASSDGSKEYNRRLSSRRADAVVRYLAENHDIPLRRIITPFGYGDAKPVSDNGTRQGREENRRVEVTILVSKGLAASPSAMPSTSSSNTGKNPE